MARPQSEVTHPFVTMNYSTTKQHWSGKKVCRWMSSNKGVVVNTSRVEDTLKKVLEKEFLMMNQIKNETKLEGLFFLKK